MRQQLHFAAQLGMAADVRKLIEQGAEIDARDHLGRTALHGTRSPDVLRLLVAAGADINATDTDGRTLLHLIANLDRAPLIIAALAAGADLDLPDAQGRSARTRMRVSYLPHEMEAMQRAARLERSHELSSQIESAFAENSSGEKGAREDPLVL